MAETLEIERPLVEIAPGLSLPQGFKSYQDIWLKGQIVQVGKRTCARRYKMIYDALVQRYRPGFALLDIGASEGYFSIRLSEDFNARATMLEKKAEISSIVSAQDNPNLRAVSGRFDAKKLSSLGQFDVVIALSIIHHFPNWGEMIKKVLAIGDTVFVELPAQDERATKRAGSASGMMEILDWYKPTLVGETSGYAEEAKRQLWCVDFPTPPAGESVVTGTLTGGRSSSTRQAKHYRAGFLNYAGAPVFPGTLNLKLNRSIYFKNGMKIESEKGAYYLYPCRIEGLAAYVVKPPLAKNRANTLEIMSTVSLREVFGLIDGSSVRVELDPRHLGTKEEIEYAVKLPLLGALTSEEPAAAESEF